MVLPFLFVYVKTASRQDAVLYLLLHIPFNDFRVQRV